MRKLIIIRPQPAADESLAEARRLGLDAQVIPLFAIEPVTWEPPDPNRFVALAATSANAFRHGGENLAALQSLPVHAVGAATAAAAREAGFSVASVGKAGREAMELPRGPVLHLAGRDHLPLPGDATVRIVYASVPIDPPPSLAAIRDAVVAVHSPRAGLRLRELTSTRDRTVVAAISRNAAEACGGGWQQLHVAAAPREDELLALAVELCQN